MNLLCPVCGEEWEFDYLHDVAAEQEKTFKQVSRSFQVKGCEALGESHTKLDTRLESDEGRDDREFKAMAASAIYELMGDDMDGAASAFDDEGW